MYSVLLSIVALPPIKPPLPPPLVRRPPPLTRNTKNIKNIVKLYIIQGLIMNRSIIVTYYLSLLKITKTLTRSLCYLSAETINASSSSSVMVSTVLLILPSRWKVIICFLSASFTLMETDPFSSV